SPNNLGVIFATAELEVERKNIDAARAELQRAHDLFPKEWRVYQAQAHLETEDRKADAAVKGLRTGLEQLPGQLDLEWNLARLLAALGKASEAGESIGRLEKKGLPSTELDFLRARLLYTEEKWAEAAQLLETIYPYLAARGNPERD